MNNKMLELAKELKAAAIKLKVNKYDHVWLKNELTDDWSHGSPYEYFALLSNYHQVIKLCEYIEHASTVNGDNSKLIQAFCSDDAECHKLLDAKEQEIKQLRGEQFNKEQMKLGVLFARNHLISAYRANFIDCDLKEFAKFMSLLSHVANESIDIELMMSDVLACNEQAEEWIKSALEQENEI